MRALARAIGWQCYKRIARRPVSIAFHGKRLICYPDSSVTTAALYYNGLADYWEMRFLLDYLRPGDGFLDVGANVGVYTLLAASRVGNEGRVDALEPSEKLAKRIEQQISINGLNNTFVHQVAVGEHNGEVDFVLSPDNATSHIYRQSESLLNKEIVRCIRLDDWYAINRYALGKIDIEGAEPLAFRGADNMLGSHNPPVWIMEAAGYSKLYGTRTDELINHLKARGYDCYVYDPETRRMDAAEKPWEKGVQNVLVVARKEYSNVRRRLNGA